MVKLKLHEIKLTKNVNDGLFGDAELLAVFHVRHRHHFENYRFTTEQSDFDCSVSLSWQPVSTFYTHPECSPRTDINCQVALTELDCGSRETAIAVLTSAARAALACYFGPIACGVAVVGGVVTIAIVGLNGHDDLGAGSAELNVYQTVTLPLRGKDAGADVKIEDITFVEGDTGQCSGQRGDTPPDPMLLADEIYSPLMDAISLIPSIDVEPDDPQAISDADLVEVRTSFRRMTLGWAQSVAGAAVDDARNFDGAAAALADYEMAQALESVGDDLAAVSAYESAFLEAALAIQGGTPGPAVPLPLHLVVTPDYYSTVVTRDVNLMAVVLGAVSGSTSLEVVGMPPGMTYSVLPAESGMNAYSLLLNTENVPRGEYPMTVVADNGGNVTTRAITVILNIRPGDANCDGREDILDINPFILALSDPTAYAAEYPNCDLSAADVNLDGNIDVLDIQPFIQRIED